MKSKVANFFDRRKVQSPRKQFLCALQKFGFKFVFMTVGGYFLHSPLAAFPEKLQNFFTGRESEEGNFFSSTPPRWCAEGRFRRLPHFHCGRFGIEKKISSHHLYPHFSPQKPIGINLAADRKRGGEAGHADIRQFSLSLNCGPDSGFPFRFFALQKKFAA